MPQIPDNITRQDIEQAIEKIDQEGIPKGAHSSTYDVIYNDKPYPPKLVVSYANLFANGVELPRDQFHGGKDQPAFKLLKSHGFVIEKKELVENASSDTSSAWLLTWNPKHFSEGGDGTSQHLSGLEVGVESRWTCQSKNVQLGDRVYLMRVGIEPRGIIATGVITQEPYLDEDFRDSSKQRHYVKFKTAEVRETCKQGLLPMLLLQEISKDQQWSPQSSGIKIQSDILSSLNQAWQEGEGIHSLKQLFNWFSKHEFNQVWLERYSELTQWVEAIRRGEKTIDEAFIKRLWREHSNGIASVKQGIISNADFDKNKDYLFEVTKSLIADPNSKELSRKIISDWQNGPGHFTKLNRAIIHRAFAACSPKSYATMTNEGDCKQLLKYLNTAYQCSPSAKKDWFKINTCLMQCLVEAGIDPGNYLNNNRYFWKIFTLLNNTTEESEVNISEVREDNSRYSAESESPMSLNQILYGPPGTGKTYNTVIAAVNACEPGFTANTKDYRGSYKKRYDQLVEDGRIRFVTFHQSYGYEEFVEGLRASSESGDITYDVASGVFKQLAHDTDKHRESSEENPLADFETCWHEFIGPLEDQDVITVPMKRTEFTIFDVSESTIYFEKDSGGRNHTLSITTLKALFEGKRSFGSGLKSYYSALIDQLKNLAETLTIPATPKQNYVLIIDEINRGNISKIFGELITLIEPSKRVGEDEALTVKLPYSGETFGVPNNLYIIGTMNTADRSLAMMDTALRRRFDFVEMMPQSSLLSGVKPMEIDLEVMLTTMNQRIEYLYDREHTLGHAFFMPVKEAWNQNDKQAAFNELQNTFKNKVIPLLEEYFFEDWEKIRLVLADNQVKDSSLQFIHAQEQGADSLQNLFGSNFPESNFGDSSVKYHVNPSPDMPADAFIKIYNSSVVQEAEQDSDNS